MRTPQRHQARDSGFLARQARVKRPGFTGIAITSTYEAGPGLHSAII